MMVSPKVKYFSMQRLFWIKIVFTSSENLLEKTDSWQLWRFLSYQKVAGV